VARKALDRPSRPKRRQCRATWGSGDVLAGPGVLLHGEAGRILTERVGRVSFLAEEIAALVPGLLDTQSPFP
jgi:NAD(P)H-hydrate repair Nnr-like enzyme with NAD(P)H-hydrate dehydratase domain